MNADHDEKIVAFPTLRARADPPREIERRDLVGVAVLADFVLWLVIGAVVAALATLI